jgi:glycerol-3-phosphate O-acyltransferase
VGTTLLTIDTNQSVAVTALYSLLSTETNSPHMAGSYRMLSFTVEQIQQCALDLCEILQFEFIFTKPCQQLEAAIEDVLTQFKYKEIITCTEVCCCLEIMVACVLA